MKKFLTALLLFASVCPALGQQPLKNHAIPIGRGAGVAGYNTVGPCNAAVPIVGAGASLDPVCHSSALGSMASQSASNVAITGGTISASSVTASTLSSAGANITGGTITNMPSPSLSGDVANKAYVDAVATGLKVLAQSLLATTTALPANTYANGASGVGATLTATSNGALTVDSTAVSAGNIILVKDEATAANNGIYTVTAAGSGGAPYVLTRVTYFDTAAEMLSGSYTFITGGVTNLNRSYTLAASVATVGTNAVTFSLFALSSTQWFNGSGGSIYYNVGAVGVGTGVTNPPPSPLTVAQSYVGYAALIQNTSASGSGLQVAVPTDNSSVNLLSLQANSVQRVSVSGAGTLSIDPVVGGVGVSVNQSQTCCGPDGVSIAGNVAGVSLALNNTSSTGNFWHLISYGDGTGIGGTIGLFNNMAGPTNGLFIDGNGNINTSVSISPIFSANSARFFSVQNTTAHAISELGVGANASSAGDTIGTVSFVNNSLGTTDKRVGIIDAITRTATNTAQIDVGTYNAGSYSKNATFLPWGQTNIVGELSINLEVQNGTDITSALQSALNSYKTIRVPCGTFTVTSALSYAIAGQTLSGGGRGCTTLQWSGSNFMSFLVTADTLADTTLSDLTLDANHAANLSQGCFNARAAPRTKVINVGCLHTTQVASGDCNTGGRGCAGAFQFASASNTLATGSYNSQLINCYIEDMQTTQTTYNAHAVEISFSQGVVVNGCTSKDIDNGVNISASPYVSVTGNVWLGTGTAYTGFPGVRCTNASSNATATGNVILNMPRGLFIFGCWSSAFTGNTIINTIAQSVLFAAGCTHPPDDSCGGNGNPTYYNTVTGNNFQDTCLGNGCNWAVEFSRGETLATIQGNIVTGNTYLRIASPVSTAMIGFSAPVVASANLCANNMSNISVGSC